MELWIRSQDKDHLVKIEEINIEIDEDGFIGIWSYGSNKYLKYYLGTYKSKERALEVLDEIQKRISIEIHRDNLTFQEADIVLKGKIVDSLSVIYEMPKE